MVNKGEGFGRLVDHLNLLERAIESLEVLFYHYSAIDRDKAILLKESQNSLSTLLLDWTKDIENIFAKNAAAISIINRGKIAGDVNETLYSLREKFQQEKSENIDYILSLVAEISVSYQNYCNNPYQYIEAQTDDINALQNIIFKVTAERFY
jgi:hypothetical protein